jgi:hypothetical protein
MLYIALNEFEKYKNQIKGTFFKKQSLSTEVL